MGKKTSSKIDRRALLTGVAAASVAAATARADSPASSAAAKTEAAGSVSVAQRGAYEKVALKQDFVNVAAIQSQLYSIDLRDKAATNKRNLQRVLRLIDLAQNSPEEWNGERRWGSKVDLICMHEFPIQGFQPWTRKELNQIAYELPGPESEAIGERAKRYGCYISFGCYAKEKDWPDHVINMSVLVGPDGKIVSKQWKARNILGLFGDGALIGTTVYDVLDRYVEMYGWDAVLPVARTDIGNIAITAVGAEPMLYTCLGLKGAEILVLSVTGGSNAESAIQTARANRLYTLGVGNAVSPNNIGFPESSGTRDEGTVIVDPRGTVLAKTNNHHEDIITARIPIADFRKTRRVQELPMALMLPVFQQYQPTFQPNAFMDKLPATYQEAGEIVRKRMSMKSGG
ncbi:MAG: nitrilase-related carbon-nitrogen hydrolase [Steroidobacteraceae bacterium]|jgi:predicted amidohydrolase